MLSVIALACFVLRPEWIGQRVEHVSGRLAILIDNSRSMLVREGAATRRDLALEWVKKAYDAAKKKPELLITRSGASRSFCIAA